MGNCLALQDKVIKVAKPDGEVVLYRAPIKVDQILSDYVGHAISDTLPVVRHLRRDMDLCGGQVYSLLPLPLIIGKKKVNSNCDVELTEARDRSNKVVRIKLVMSMQELEAMLRKGILVSDLVSRLQENESLKKSKEIHDEGNGSSRGWKPQLESISE